MTIEDLANQWVLGLKAYEPGKPIADTALEHGLDPAKIVKLASNENPLGPSPQAVEAMRRVVAGVHIYPDGGGLRLRDEVAARHGLGRENIVLGNGSNEVIEFLCHSFLRPGVGLVASRHAFVVYKLMASLFGADYVEVEDPGFCHDLEGMADAIDERTRLVFVANPNNPTGTMVGQEAIDAFMARGPEHVVVVFDEAYYEFLDEAPDLLKYVKAGRRVVILRTFSKIHGLAGLRIGYGMMSVELASVVQKSRQPFNTNLLAQEAALAALKDEAHIEMTKRMNDEGLMYLQGEFDRMGLEYLPSVANFVMVKVGDADWVFGELLKKGVIIRSMTAYQLPEWVRVSVGTAKENQVAIACLQEVIGAAYA